MLANIPLRDFKPDVVICPNCTQHLMGVKDVRWASNKVEFTYSCSGCGAQLEKPLSEDLSAIIRAQVDTDRRIGAGEAIAETRLAEPKPAEIKPDANPVETAAREDIIEEPEDDMEKEHIIAAPASAETAEELEAFPFRASSPAPELRTSTVLKPPFLDARLDERVSPRTAKPARAPALAEDRTTATPKPAFTEDRIAASKPNSARPIFSEERATLRISALRSGEYPDPAHPDLPIPTTRASVLLRDVPIF